MCEYKGGPSCPDGMFSFYGKCLGFVKNIMDNNTANDKTCYFQSGAVNNYRLAQVDNVQVIIIFSFFYNKKAIDWFAKIFWLCWMDIH